jgi:hypothetical protein
MNSTQKHETEAEQGERIELKSGNSLNGGSWRTATRRVRHGYGWKKGTTVG